MKLQRHVRRVALVTWSPFLAVGWTFAVTFVFLDWLSEPKE